jgi:hypothetical protein
MITLYGATVIGRRPMILVVTEPVDGDLRARLALQLGTIPQNVKLYRLGKSHDDDHGFALYVDELLGPGMVQKIEFTSIDPEEFTLLEESTFSPDHYEEYELP